MSGACLWAITGTLASAQDPSPEPAKPDVEEARATRLAAQRTALEAELAAMEKFGRTDEYLAAIAAIADGHAASRDPDSEWHPIADGALPFRSIETYAKWHRPAPGRELPVCIDAELPNHPLPAIVDFRDQLKTRNVGLLVVLIPARVEIYPELLMPMPESVAESGFAGMGIGTVRFLLALNAAGVETVDLRPAFVAARFGVENDPGKRKDPKDPRESAPKDELFLKTDPHWRPRGAELAAKTTSETIATLPWFAPGPLKQGHGFAIEKKPILWCRDVNDLASDYTKPEDVTISSVIGRSGTFLDAVNEKGRVIVMGDSFVRVYSSYGGDYTTHLARFLGQRVDLIQAPGAATKECREKLGFWKPEQWKGRKLVVWCLISPNLRPSDKWVKVDLFR